MTECVIARPQRQQIALLFEAYIALTRTCGCMRRSTSVFLSGIHRRIVGAEAGRLPVEEMMAGCEEANKGCGCLRLVDAANASLTRQELLPFNDSYGDGTVGCARSPRASPAVQVRFWQSIGTAAAPSDARSPFVNATVRARLPAAAFLATTSKNRKRQTATITFAVQTPSVRHWFDMIVAMRGDLSVPCTAWELVTQPFSTRKATWELVLPLVIAVLKWGKGGPSPT
eukprot:IDg17917t1